MLPKNTRIMTERFYCIYPDVVVAVSFAKTPGCLETTVTAGELTFLSACRDAHPGLYTFHFYVVLVANHFSFRINAEIFQL